MYDCDLRTSAGKQEDAGQIDQRNRKGEARPSDPREETNYRDQEKRQARADGVLFFLL